MFTYETGLLIGFFIWLYSLVNLIVSINSQFNKNLIKIGQRLSWLTLTPKMMDDKDELDKPIYIKVIKFIFIAFLGLLSVLLSWLYVVWVIGTYIYRRSKDSGVPEVIKNFRWKMRNVDMTRDQIILELFKTTERDMSEFEDFKENYISELEACELI